MYSKKKPFFSIFFYFFVSNAYFVRKLIIAGKKKIETDYFQKEQTLPTQAHPAAGWIPHYST